MKLSRRLSSAALALAVLAGVSAARAQVIKQIPSDAIIVLKANNPDAVSAKVAAFAQKLGLAQMLPPLTDPIGALKGQLAIKGGFEGKGELAIAIFDAAAGEHEPRVAAYIPVSDYKAFLGNFANVKSEGDISTFTAPEDTETLYSVNWGSYAVVTPFKDLVAQKPATTLVVAGASGKQLDSNDITAYVNAKVLREKLLPQFKAARPMMLQGLDGELQRNPQFNQKFTPAVKALVNQVLNTAEETLTDTDAATIGIRIDPDKGINATVLADFNAATYIGKTFASFKNSAANVLAGLPNRKYFAVGGGVIEPAPSLKLLSDLTDPIAAELKAVGPDAKPILDILTAVKEMTAASTAGAAGYVVPTGPNQGILQAVAVNHGDAKVIAAAQEKTTASTQQLMDLLPKTPGVGMAWEAKPARTIEGSSLKVQHMGVNIDRNSPQGAQAGMAIDLMYGPNGMDVLTGAVTDKTFVMAMGGDDELASAVVKAAKTKDASLAADEGIKAVSDGLPKERIGVYYIQVDNIATQVLATMGKFGMNVPFQVKPTHPIGISVATEGSALRIDTFLSSTFIEDMVANGMQAFMAAQGARRGGM